MPHCSSHTLSLSPPLSSAATDSFYDRGILYLGRHLFGRRHKHPGLARYDHWRIYVKKFVEELLWIMGVLPACLNIFLIM